LPCLHLIGFSLDSCRSSGFCILFVFWILQLVLWPLLLCPCCLLISQHTPAVSGWDLAQSLTQSLEQSLSCLCCCHALFYSHLFVFIDHFAVHQFYTHLSECLSL
jgi:hypothetical protein